MSDSTATSDRRSSSSSSSSSRSRPDSRSDSTGEPITDAATERDDRRFLERTVPSLAPSIRKVGFWTAIVLPFCYVPFLLYGLSSPLATLAFLVVLAINLVALYVGHAHRQ